MFQLKTEAGIEEIHSFELDDFDCIRSLNNELNSSIEFGERDRQLPFSELFSDDNTRDLFQRVVAHVRATSESISFPYRCDSETHCVYLQIHISKVSSQSLRFANKVISSEKRPPGIILSRLTCTEHWDYIACSICSRLCDDNANHEHKWNEFQFLLDTGVWKNNGQAMRCKNDVCEDCSRAISQRMYETKRGFESKAA